MTSVLMLISMHWYLVKVSWTMPLPSFLSGVYHAESVVVKVLTLGVSNQVQLVNSNTIACWLLHADSKLCATMFALSIIGCPRPVKPISLPGSHHQHVLNVFANGLYASSNHTMTKTFFLATSVFFFSRLIEVLKNITLIYDAILNSICLNVSFLTSFEMLLVRTQEI